MKRLAGTTFLVAFTLVGGACADRTKMTPSHGQAVSRAIAAQTANPGAAQRPRPLPGFDAQEASLIAKGYRQSLLPPKTAAPEDKGMVILAPSQTGQPYLPPPSVPSERK